MITAVVTVDLSRLHAMVGGSEFARGGGSVGSSGGVFGAMRLQWAKRYEAFARKRFNANSRGGGDGTWPPLALTTLERRRQGPNAARTKGKVVDGKHVFDPRAGYISLGRDTKIGRSRVYRNGELDLNRPEQLVGAIFFKKNGDAFAVSANILKDTGILFNALTIGQMGNRVQAIPFGVRYGFTEAPHPPRKGSKKSKLTIARLASIHHNGNPARHLPRRTILVQPDAQTLRGMANDYARAVVRAANGGAQ